VGGWDSEKRDASGPPVHEAYDLEVDHGPPSEKSTPGQSMAIGTRKKNLSTLGDRRDAIFGGEARAGAN